MNHKQFSRSIDLFGSEGFSTLQRSMVVVVGLGGVGSHAALALARSGVGCLRLVDFDRVTISGLNRHAVATRDHLGLPKVELMRRHLLSVNPGLVVETRSEFFHRETAAVVLDEGSWGPVSYVVDAIDSFAPKVALLTACRDRGLRVIACMGASARTDPTLLRMADIAETRVCPLARVVRKALYRQGIRAGIPCVFSVEKPLDTLPPDESDIGLRRGRPRRRLPSLPVMPGIFGLAAAGHVIQALACPTDRSRIKT